MEMLNVNMMLGFDLWQTIIAWFGSWITNYGWAIIIFTIALKLVMLPLDIFQRKSSQKQSRFMAIMQQEMQALQAKYGNDREKINQEQAKLYKKYNVNMGGMCLSMLLTMGLSLVVFFTLFASLRSFGEVKLYDSYNQLDKVCVTYLNENSITTNTLTDENYDKNEITVLIKKEYENVSDKNSWLWVKNVWKSDTKTSQFVDVNEYISYQGYETDETKEAAKIRYNFIVETIEGEKTQQNGYYVLIILAAAVSFLTQFLSAKLTTPKGQKLNTMNKVMFLVLPISMIFFAMSSNAVFALYIITNSIMTTLISTVITLIMRHKDKGKTPEELLQPKKVEVVEYSRNYKK